MNAELTPERKPFKEWFDDAAAHMLSAQVAGTMPSFDQPKFVALATANLTALEFAGRVKQFSNALARTLPESVPHALDILRASLPEVLPDCESVTDGWLQWPVG